MAVDFGLQGQVAIVTGSTSGIGHALADGLAAQGVNIVMNGLGEMNAIERARAEMAEKHRVYGERYPLDEDFLSALAHMPPASGIALGFDRLVVLATGAPRIDEVIWAPVP